MGTAFSSLQIVVLEKINAILLTCSLMVCLCCGSGCVSVY